MARRLTPETVRQFRGMNAWHSVDRVPPDYALECLNVIPSGSGGLEKMRFPVNLMAAPQPDLAGTGTLVNFQNALGVRQVLALFNGYLYRIDLDAWTATQIEYNVLNEGVPSAVVSNNMAFVANGLRMAKWTGTEYQPWGIAQPPLPLMTIVPITGTGDPTEAPVVWSRPLDPDEIPPSGIWLGPRTISVSYTWCIGATETLESPATVYNVPMNHEAIMTVPEPPAGVTGYNVYVDPLGGANRKRANTEGHHGVPNPFIVPNYMPRVFDEVFPFWWGMFGYVSPPAANNTLTGQVRATGRKYRVAYGNSVTGHISAASAATDSTGALLATDQTEILVANPTDANNDQIWLFATVDGGSDYFLLPNPSNSDGSWPIDGGSTTKIVDQYSDDVLVKSFIAPMLNFPPVVAKYLCEWGGRIFCANLAGAPQDIIYSGYERIYRGRPEESFPPNNRLRLAIGSDALAGIGVIQAGIVAFSRSNEMFMYRGTVTDRSTDAPVEYLDTLEKLPWNLGCASHESIARTPHGLVWLASDKNLMIYSGVNEPTVIGQGLLPMLRRITAGQEEDCRGRYFSYLERDWYLLLAPLDGSTGKNHIFVVDLEASEANVGAFPLHVNADALEVVEDGNGKPKLVIMQGGQAKELLLSSDTTGGISLEYAATANEVPAHWRSARSEERRVGKECS